MARLYPELAEREISIAVASCQSSEDIHQWITQQKSEFPFVFLADEKREMAKAYGVYKRIGWDSVNIAKPATLFLDSSGTLRFIDVWNSQFHVPTQDALLRIIHEVVGK